MNYSNNDSRLSGKFIVPEDRIKLIRQLEQEVIAEREKRKNAKLPKSKSKSGNG